MSIQIENNRGFVGAFIPKSVSARLVSFDDEMMHVSLADGRIISTPLAWFPRLQNASTEARQNYEISPSGYGIHWPDVDEDLSVAGLLAGADTALL